MASEMLPHQNVAYDLFTVGGRDWNDWNTKWSCDMKTKIEEI